MYSCSALCFVVWYDVSLLMCDEGGGERNAKAMRSLHMTTSSAKRLQMLHITLDVCINTWCIGTGCDCYHVVANMVIIYIYIDGTITENKVNEYINIARKLNSSKVIKDELTIDRLLTLPEVISTRTTSSNISYKRILSKSINDAISDLIIAKEELKRKGNKKRKGSTT